MTAALFIAFWVSGAALAADIGDHYDPYVTADQIHAVPSGMMAADERMSDHYDPYLLAHEIIVTEGCTDPAVALIADPYDPFVTLSELKAASMTKRC
jgi:hypothetical protein